MPKLLPPIRYAFKAQGQKVNLYRQSSSTQKDAFGRSLTNEPALVGSVTVLLDNTTDLAAFTQSPDRTSTIIKGKYSVLLSDTPVQNGDTFTANGIDWIVIKIKTVAALQIAELYVEAV